MRRLIPSPATTIALIALVVALAGSAYAAIKIDTPNIRRGAITANKLALGSVTNRAIAADAVTGDKVAEGTLGKVPSATNADQATDATTVGGMRAQKFAVEQPVGTALTSIATLGTLDLRAGCDASGHVLLEVRPASGAAAQVTRFSLHTNPGGTATTGGGGQGSLPAGGMTILDGTEGSASKDGTIESDTLNGAVTTVQWAARDGINNFPTANPDPNKCFTFGTALSG
ncbi:MAG: hypothetical protein QOI10_3349 [Solirubrobacterales bacterium]|jgi:hypothetical protein|nr:hypothetical protein [Solirubrobacterales bacterium]